MINFPEISEPELIRTRIRVGYYRTEIIILDLIPKIAGTNTRQKRK
jgi:hypothetical protein